MPLSLVLYSLDEHRQEAAEAAAQIIGELQSGPMPSLRLRVACRTAEWPGVLDEQLPRLWRRTNDAPENDAPIAFYALVPLRNVDVAAAAKEDAARFLKEVARIVPHTAPPERPAAEHLHCFASPLLPYVRPVGRKKAQLLRKDGYARRIAAWRGVEMLFSRAFETSGPRSVRVESEHDPGWDDIVEELEIEDGRIIRRGWQVKLQATAFEAEPFAKMLRLLHASHRLDRGCLGLPSAVEVKGVGGLSALQELCRRASQPGCDPGALATTKDEQQWWKFLGKIARPTEKRLSMLRRLEVHILRDELEIESIAIARLKHLFKEPTKPIFRNIEAFFGSIDDSRVVDVELLDREVLRPFASQRLPTAPTLRTARAEYLAEVRSAADARVPLANLATPNRISLREVRVPLRQLNGPLDDGARRSLRDWLRAPRGDARILLLFGEVGSGKTELLALTAAELAADAEADAEQPIPLLVNARTLAAGDLEQAARTRWPAVVDAVAHLLQASTIRWIVLLDGLDEAGSRGLDATSALRRRFGDRLHAFVASTRPSLRPSLPGAIEVWLPPWTAQETEQFLVRWGEHDPAAVATLRRSPHREALEVLCANPLTATLCLLAAHRKPETLRSRADVYASVVEGLFDGWARARAEAIGGARVQWSAVAPVLRRLALEVVHQERSPIPRRLLQTRLRREAPDLAWTAEEALELDLGVLVRVGDDAYEFAIRGLAEHLAGQELLERVDPAIVEAASEPWAEEVCRHAIGWAALTEPRRALELLKTLLQNEQEDDLVSSNVHLRPVLVATRAAADLGAAAQPVADALIHACLRRLLDETSLWIGDRMADAMRELMHAGARCWALLAQSCLDFACDQRLDRAAWYEAQTWENPDAWANLLYERDPEVRRVAVERLAAWVDEPVVRSFLVLETLDDGWRIGGSAPAIAAGLALRRARRDEQFAELRQILIGTLEQGAQLSACAAAVALLPEETDPELLATAFRHGAHAFPFPSAIIEDLARSEAGRSALDRAWPGWEEVIAKGLHARRPLPPCPGEEPPPASEAVRDRLIRAVAPALRREDVIEQLLETSHFAAPNALCELAYDHPALVSPLLRLSSKKWLPLLSPAAQEALGRAALRHRAVRDQLIALWEAIGPRSSLPAIETTVRQHYPGHALEPLIRRGDADAISAYAEWLPNAPLLMIGRLDPPPLPPEILAPESIQRAARAQVDLVWGYATRGIINETTGERSFLASTTAGSVLHCLWPVWHKDASLRAELDAWIVDKDVNRLTAVLHALEGLSLPPPTQDLVARGLFEQMKGHEHDWGTFVVVILPRVLRFLHRTGMTAKVAPLLKSLAESQTSIACHATAVLIPLLEEEEAARLSRAASETPWLSREIEMIDEPLLRRMIELAPEAWASALESAVPSFSTPLTRLLLPFLSGLPIALKRRVLLAWAGSAGAMTLPWSWEGYHANLPARPSDRVHQLLFDHGFEHKPGTASV